MVLSGNLGIRYALASPTSSNRYVMVGIKCVYMLIDSLWNWKSDFKHFLTLRVSLMYPVMIISLSCCHSGNSSNLYNRFSDPVTTTGVSFSSFTEILFLCLNVVVALILLIKLGLFYFFGDGAADRNSLTPNNMRPSILTLMLMVTISRSNKQHST